MPLFDCPPYSTESLFLAITAVPVESIKFHPSFPVKYALHFVYANAILNSSHPSAHHSLQQLVIQKKRINPCRICSGINHDVVDNPFFSNVPDTTFNIVLGQMQGASGSTLKTITPRKPSQQPTAFLREIHSNHLLNLQKKRTSRKILLHRYRMLFQFQHDRSSLLIIKDGKTKRRIGANHLISRPPRLTLQPRLFAVASPDIHTADHRHLMLLEETFHLQSRLLMSHDG